MRASLVLSILFVLIGLLPSSLILTTLLLFGLLTCALSASGETPPIVLFAKKEFAKELRDVSNIKFAIAGAGAVLHLVVGLLLGFGGIPTQVLLVVEFPIVLWGFQVWHMAHAELLVHRGAHGSLVDRLRQASDSARAVYIDHVRYSQSKFGNDHLEAVAEVDGILKLGRIRNILSNGNTDTALKAYKLVPGFRNDVLAVMMLVSGHHTSALEVLGSSEEIAEASFPILYDEATRLAEEPLSLGMAHRLFVILSGRDPGFRDVLVRANEIDLRIRETRQYLGGLEARLKEIEARLGDFQEDISNALSVAAVDPTAGFGRVYPTVERAIKNVYSARHGNTSTWFQMTERLVKEEVLPPDVAHHVNSVRVRRNDIAHGKGAATVSLKEFDSLFRSTLLVFDWYVDLGKESLPK